MERPPVLGPGASPVLAALSHPAGVALNDRGEVVGTPSVSGLFDATVRLTDAVVRCEVDDGVVCASR